ncbi:MAG: asparagine synthase (glutamine-hydrolyzing), partial [Sphingobacteriales bacterium]
MCGITGLYTFNKNETLRISHIERATNILSLRGPDCGNFYNDSLTALGHRRLSIIDTSAAANQPMADKTGRYLIVFNGEIFNFKELAASYLTNSGGTGDGIRSHSDTEVLLNLLIKYGTECLTWLSGFFAFAFYDRETGDMILARDRFGKKPLLYYQTDSYLAFASEMKSLLAWDIPRKLDYNTLEAYLQLNYVPPDQSMLEGVKKVQPGTYLQINQSGVTAGVYYELRTRPEDYGQYSYEQAKTRFVELMDHAVQERLIADVPLGAFLSGGIDSSVIVALASRHTSHLNTFSVGYKDNSFFDETSYAELVARKFATNHTVFSLSNDDFLEHVYDVLDYLDEPFADSSAIPTYILCRRTRSKVTVALSGDGGDEIFSGYNKHAAEWRTRQKNLANTMVTAGLPIWKLMPRSHNNRLTNMFRQLHRFAEGSRLSVSDRYWRWASVSPLTQARELLSKGSLDQIDVRHTEQLKRDILKGIKTDDFNEILLTDMKLVLPGDMLVKVDMMSMANSLEVRSPFLDYKVVDFAFGLPASYKIQDGLKKKIVQDAFRPMLPPELYNRPKHGFEIPLSGWLKKELWGLIDEDLLASGFIKEQGIF